ncbi:hypothetical protein IAQ61_005330, partial [Plenodomus lingam]|uniref:uncharacterized protein n=1 Tax=Leptosphaeria maculans TaxID=5022 RepID=UPI00332BFD4B
MRPPHDQPPHLQQSHHEDHDIILARLDNYIRAYRTRNPDEMMKFYHPDKLVYSDITANRHNMSHEEVKATYAETFTHFHDLDIQTLSLHGHRDFTAWEWEIRCRPGVDVETGGRMGREEAGLKRVVGCTLMWWEGERIVRNHDYVVVREG